MSFPWVSIFFFVFATTGSNFTNHFHQVAIGHIVPGGAADMDQRLKTGDEIMKVNGQSTVNESHHKVVGLMGQASSQGFVHLTVRRRIVVNGR